MNYLQKYVYLSPRFTGFLIYSVNEMVNKFYSYPFVITRKNFKEIPMKFPALTFCNMNPVEKSALNREMSGGNVNY